MLLLEDRWGTSIESLIRKGSVTEIAEKLEVEPSTISRWRIKLGLRTKRKYERKIV